MSNEHTIRDAPSPDPGDYLTVELKTDGEPAFQKPDHDPHGETAAVAAHSGTSCDICGQSGLVQTAALETLVFDDGPDHLRCQDCAQLPTSRPGSGS